MHTWDPPWTFSVIGVLPWYAHPFCSLTTFRRLPTSDILTRAHVYITLFTYVLLLGAHGMDLFDFITDLICGFSTDCLL